MAMRMAASGAVIVERLSFGVLGHAESAPQQVKIGHLRRVLDLSVEILEYSRTRGNVSDAKHLIDITIEAISPGLLQNRFVAPLLKSQSISRLFAYRDFCLGGNTAPRPQ